MSYTGRRKVSLYVFQSLLYCIVFILYEHRYGISFRGTFRYPQNNSKPGNSQSPLLLTRLRKTLENQYGREFNSAYRVLVHLDVKFLGKTYRKEKLINSNRS